LEGLQLFSARLLIDQMITFKTSVIDGLFNSLNMRDTDTPFVKTALSVLRAKNSLGRFF
jgi:hypothetical protein